MYNNYSLLNEDHCQIQSELTAALNVFRNACLLYYTTMHFATYTCSVHVSKLRKSVHLWIWNIAKSINHMRTVASKTTKKERNFCIEFSLKVNNGFITTIPNDWNHRFNEVQQLVSFETYHFMALRLRCVSGAKCE